MKLFLLTCGHVLKIDSKRSPSGNYERMTKSGSPVCERCGSHSMIDRKLKNQYDGLEGRYAVCGERKVRSSWMLPGFVYCPDEPVDKFLWSNRLYVKETHGVSSVSADLDSSGKPVKIPPGRSPRPRTKWFEDMLAEKKNKK